jgi:hypothetical protein
MSLSLVSLGVIDLLVDTFGPFLIPVAIFAAGLLGYGLLFALSKLW